MPMSMIRPPVLAVQPLYGNSLATGTLLNVFMLSSFFSNMNQTRILLAISQAIATRESLDVDDNVTTTSRNYGNNNA